MSIKSMVIKSYKLMVFVKKLLTFYRRILMSIKINVRKILEAKLYGFSNNNIAATYGISNNIVQDAVELQRRMKYYQNVLSLL